MKCCTVGDMRWTDLSSIVKLFRLHFLTQLYAEDHEINDVFAMQEKLEFWTHGNRWGNWTNKAMFLAVAFYI